MGVRAVPYAEGNPLWDKEKWCKPAALALPLLIREIPLHKTSVLEDLKVATPVSAAGS